ncbi:MAG TPA: YdeI/OmpD-associated family protein [Actinomycetota bacterium]|nr:YdeI/OmpD-associated family protein [Actinomycetota bacterium]
MDGLEFPTQAAFERWLAEDHAKSDGIWLKIAKKGARKKTVTYAEAVEVALCYGWIDGQMKRLDDEYFVQRFTPRRARSKWSKINVGKVEDLIARGKMKPPGLAEVERAKADGRWAAAYDSPSTATVPDDLAAALEAKPAAKELFEKLTSSQRYSILYQLQDAKRAETRARRIAKFVDMLDRGDRPG